MNDHDLLDYFLAMLHLPEVGPVRARELLQRFDNPRRLFDVGGRDTTLEPALREALRNPAWEKVDRSRKWAGAGRHILTLTDPAYPPLLKQLGDAPLVLFVHGTVEVLATPQLAMVGSRNPTPTGETTAFEFAKALAGAGLTITSGLALGIDGASHRGALAGGGQTVAVLGTGPDRIYPASNRDLAHAIVDGGGALVSEYLPGTPPLPTNFPRRNRIISGLALGTLVVEAALRSGSLITARNASEQGREVFAIPGSIHNPLAKGCHRLIREGAKLVETAQDILVELAPQLRLALAEQAPGHGVDPMQNLDADYSHLLDCLGFEPTPVDILVERSGLTADVVSSMLLILELDGYVAAAAGGGYCRTSKESLS